MHTPTFDVKILVEKVCIYGILAKYLASLVGPLHDAKTCWASSIVRPLPQQKLNGNRVLDRRSMTDRDSDTLDSLSTEQKLKTQRNWER